MPSVAGDAVEGIDGVEGEADRGRPPARLAPGRARHCERLLNSHTATGPRRGVVARRIAPSLDERVLSRLLGATRSRVIDRAKPKTHAWNRRTRTTQLAGSQQIEETSASSDTLSAHVDIRRPPRSGISAIERSTVRASARSTLAWINDPPHRQQCSTILSIASTCPNTTVRRRPPAPQGWGSLITRLAGAIAVLVVGFVPSAGPRRALRRGGPIGELFIVNFVAAAAIGAALLLPLERFAGGWGTLAIVLASVAGIGVAGGSLVMLIIAEHGTLFGFHEPGYDPAAISRSRLSSATSVGLLTASLAMRRLARRTPRW